MKTQKEILLEILEKLKIHRALAWELIDNIKSNKFDELFYTNMLDIIENEIIKLNKEKENITLQRSIKNINKLKKLQIDYDPIELDNILKQI